jgi:Ca-activated chloride channel family protein
LLNYTAGDAGEALQWMNELDKQYNLTNDEYGMGDFIDELKQKGYLNEDNQSGEFNITAKTEQSIRQSALEEIFGKLKKSGAVTTVRRNRARAMSVTRSAVNLSLAIVWIR